MAEVREDSKDDCGVVSNKNPLYLLHNHSTFLQIIVCHTRQFGHAIGQTSLETNLRVLMKRKKVWQVFW